MEHCYSIWQSRKAHKSPCEPSYHHLTQYFKNVYMHLLPYLQCHSSLSLFLMGMLQGAKQDKPKWESILLQPVLKAYQTWHSWIITMHIPIGNINKQLCMFHPKKTLAHELLMKLQYQPFTCNFILNALLGEVTNINSSYQLYKPPIWTALQLLWTEPFLNKLLPADSPQPKRSLLPFLEDTLQWLTGTATTKDMTQIKQQINLMKKRTYKTIGNFRTHYFYP